MKDKNINGLLIEDNADDTMLFMDLLAAPAWPSFKFTFTCADNLKTGLKLLAEGGIEVILLDLTLPDSSGIETVLKVRAQAPRIPIVVLTGMRDEELGLEALRNGVQDYQVKGEITGHALRRTISYAVERYRLMASIQSIIENSPDGMAIADSKERIVYVNPVAAGFLAGDPARLLGAPFPFPLPDGAFGELKIPQAGGVERAVELRVTQIAWNDEPARLVLMREITELRRNEQLQAEILERRKLDKLKDEFMSVVFHEMRSPLTIIKGAADSLRDGVAGPLSTKQNDMILLQSENILRLEKGIRHILDLSRLESGKAQISLQRVNAAQLIAETARGFRLIAEKRNISIQLEIPQGLPDVYADPELFTQILSNLIDNAMRFTLTRILIRAGVAEPAPVGGGTPGVCPRRLDGAAPAAPAAPKYVRISVIDNGKGIPAEHLADLFNKFTQINRISKGIDYHGIGLGLTICKESIERQNGRIWVENPPGSGASFNFLLPQC